MWPRPPLLLASRSPPLAFRVKLNRLPLRQESSSSDRDVARDQERRVDRAKKEYRFELGEPIPHKVLARHRVELHRCELSQFNEETEWLPIYRLRLLKHARSIIRTKVYMTLLTSGLAANHIFLFLSNPAEHTLLWPLVASATTIAGLVVAGNFFRRVVVQIYICEDMKHVRISRLSAFGRRIDVIMPFEIISPMAEANTSLRRAFLNIKFRKPEDFDLSKETLEFYEDKLYLTTMYGDVYNRELLEKALGKLSVGRYVG